MGLKPRPPRFHTVYAQDWEESEQGWGVRPDGFTLHLSKEHCGHFIAKYMARQREYFNERLGEGAVPKVYTRPRGAPMAVQVENRIYQKLVRHEQLFGLWGKGNRTPLRPLLFGPTDDVHTPCWPRQ